MAKKRKKIALLFAGGGSLLSIRSNKSIFFVNQKEDMEAWLKEIPELTILAEIQPWFNLGEGQPFTAETIERVVTYLKEQEPHFDGFVVLCRAERMVQLAVACEFMLQGYSKPVIFTGSRYAPMAVAEQDIKKITKMGGLGLRSNVINAAQVASSDDFPVMAVMFGNRLIKPSKVAIANFRGINLFRSIDEDYLGKVDFGITLYRNKYRKGEKRYYDELSDEVTIVGKGLLRPTYEQLLTVGNKKKSVLLVHMLENEIVSDEQAIVLAQKFESIVAFNEYYVLEQPRSIIPLARLTWETALIKVMWAKAIAGDRQKFAQLLHENLINEFVAL